MALGDVQNAARSAVHNDTRREVIYMDRHGGGFEERHRSYFYADCHGGRKQACSKPIPPPIRVFTISVHGMTVPTMT